jgi:Transglycosylase SLT domain
MAGLVSSKDLLADDEQPVLLPGSGKNVQITGYTPPAEPERFDTKKSYGTPQKLLENVIQVESSGNPHAVNPASGAMGLGQFMPETVAMLHKQGVEFNPFKADEARAAMDYYISKLHKEHGGDYVKAMKAYGGFKTKNPEKYIDQVLAGVDLAENHPDLVKSNALMAEDEASNIPESELRAKPNLTMGRAAGLFARGATPAVTGSAIGGALAGPPGALVGSVALPVGDVLNTGINAVTGGINRFAGTNIPKLGMPSDIAQQYMTRLGLPEAQTGPERMIETAGGAMGGTAAQLPALTRLATTATSPVVRGVAETLAASPKAQIAAAAPSAVAGQAVYEKTGNPYLAMGAGALAGAPFGFSFKQRALNAPEQSELAQAAKNLYAQAENSGVQFNGNKFADQMFRAGHELRQEGFTAKGYPGIDGVLNEMTRTDVPKDFTELQAIRKMIQAQQKSTDPETRRLASILKDNFDDYVLNAPPDHITAGGPQGMKTWEAARQTYSKLKKAEIFDDMFENAQYDKNLADSLSKQMKSLAKSDKRMRVFTPEEQEAIKSVAKGNSIEKSLSLAGKFAPDSVLGILTSGGLGYGIGPTVGVPVAATTYGAKVAANKLKENAVSKLADMMRLGEMPQFESRAKNIPATALRGLLSGQPTPKGQ